jgi:hypothetical protein
MERLLQPLRHTIEAITKLKENGRPNRDWFTHLSVIAEGAPFVGWVLNVGDFALEAALFLDWIDSFHRINRGHLSMKSRILYNSMETGL